ncbi:hypothetical protein VNO77_21446 [Canavalia gladiata]|uniref:Uncharacterized protein n=1 Tax=Canavalia gladiata TaxID=3824 RepID=A0AAN9LR29_CANGL
MSSVHIGNQREHSFPLETLLGVALESGFGSTFLPTPTTTSAFHSTPNITLTTPVNSALCISMQKAYHLRQDHCDTFVLQSDAMPRQEILVKEALDFEQFGQMIA